MPVPSSTHTDKVLSTLAIGYTPRGFIGRELLTNVKVTEQSGKIRTRDKRNMFQEQDVKVGELGMPARVDAGYGETSYSCDIRSAEADYAVNVANQADVPLNLRTDGVKIAKMRLMMSEEREVADLLQTLNNYATANRTTLSGTDQWSDYDNSDPVADIDALVDEIYASPDAMMVLWMGRLVWLKLKEHPLMLERVKAGGGPGSPALVTPQSIAQVFGVDKVCIGSVKSTTSNPGATATYSHIWGKHVGIAAVEPGQSEMFLGLGGRLVHTEEEVTEIFDPRPGLKGVVHTKVANNVAIKMLANDAGCLIRDAVA